MNTLHPFIFVLGPTASGKSSLALKLASELGAQILNCDSVQSYKHVDIGTAKPTAEEMIRVPHLLFDFVEPPEEITAGQFREKARLEIDKYISWSPLIGVGGSGFYIKALQSKMYEAKDITPEALERIFETEEEAGIEGLYKKMVELDAELVGKIAPQDTYRIKRALGLMWSYDKSLTEIREQTEGQQSKEDWPYPTLKLGLQISREELRQRVRLRIDHMLKQGWLEEVQSLLTQCLENWWPMKSVGYKEMVAHLKGEISLDEAKEKTETSTMQLAKKQMTWFKKDTEIRWVSASVSVDEVKSMISALS